MNGRTLVLMYHGIGGRDPAQDPHNLFVPAEQFTGQLRSLLRRGYRPADLSGYLGGLPSERGSPRRFLVTFDDGYRGLLDEAAPILTALGVPAVCFVCPGLVGGHSTWMTETHERLLDADAVRELSRCGVEIGAHGWRHDAMTGADPQDLYRDTAGAAGAIADIVGYVPRAFAYPFGLHDAGVRTAVARSGYRVAFAVHRRCGRYAVPRVDVNALDTTHSFWVKTVTPRYPDVRHVLNSAPRIRGAVHDVVGRRSRRGDLTGPRD